MRGAEVVIVGGGVMGSACAYFLASDAAFAGRVVVFEPDPSYAACATTRSWGGVRQQFSTPENIKMSQFGIAFVRGVGEHLAVDGALPDLGFHAQGYLFLASAEGLATLRANTGLQRSLGAEVLLLEGDALASRFPWLSLDGIAGGGFGARDAGWIDPHALLRAFRDKARALGVTYRQDRVVAIERQGAAVVAVTGERSGRVPTGVVVNAAGPSAGRVAALAGARLPVAPRKRSSFVFDCRSDLSAIPLTIDKSGIAFRPEGRQYIAIMPPDPDPEVDPKDLEPDYALFEEMIWPILAARVPAFEAIKLTGAWAGHYDYNAFDQNAVIGRHPEIAGLYFCNGFSGHGLQQSPAAGRAVAELILHGGFRSLDLSRFGYERIAAGRPVFEDNIV